MKAEFLEDLNLYRIRLSYGTYRIKGKVYDGQQELSVEDISNIQKVTESEVVTHYENAGGDTKTVQQYFDQKAPLAAKKSEGEVWESLEDEFAFRKFLHEWSPCKRTVVQYSDPLPVEITASVYKTGSEFIQPLMGAEDEYGLFSYHRAECVKETVSSIFSELGMTFGGNMNYGKTEGKKIWGNLTHSCCEYVTAFGKYPLGRKWDVRYHVKGTLTDCRKQMEGDRQELATILKSKYALHFKTGIAYNAQKLMTNLSGVKQAIGKVDPKQKTARDYRRAVILVDEIIDSLVQSIADQAKET